MILAELEERQLLARFFGLGPADDGEAIEMGPPGGLVAELGHLDALAGAHVPQVRQLAFDRGRQAGDDHEPGPLRFEPLDQRVVVKPFVRADNHQPNPGGNLREARREQVARPTGGMGIAGPQLAMPEVLAPALETQQRVIRRPTAFERVVADLGLLLLAIEDEHGRVDIENQPRRRVRSCRHACQEAIVQRAQLGECRRCHAQQESPQRGGIRIGVQPREVLEHAVLPQQLGRLDPFQPEDHRVEQGEQRLADAVAVVALLQPDHLPEGSLETDPAEEPMDEVGSAVVSERADPELECQISRAFGHCVQPYPRGSIRRNQQGAILSRTHAA